jgi:hypothetical protein
MTARKTKHTTVTEKLVWLLETGRLRTQGGHLACQGAIIQLCAHGIESQYLCREEYVDWLALALVARGAINPPVIPMKDRA